MSHTRDTYALILAGGSGTRFWPLSRNAKPKQLLALFDEETLVEKAVRRLDGVVPPERILILTNEEQAAGIRQVLPQIPAENIVAEPARRDTAPAIALAAGWIAARDPEAIMVALPADQLILKEELFRELLGAAAHAADQAEAIVTLGIRPDWPCPGYGYIERGEEVPEAALIPAHPVRRVVRFREKPTVELATEYLVSGNFSWNAGIFVWSIPTLRRELAEHCPQLADFVTKLVETDSFEETLRGDFPQLDKLSIDFALMEKAGKVLNIEADIAWDDVGGWQSVAKYLDTDEAGNAVRGPVVLQDARNNIVFSESDCPLVAMLGVSDMIVVQTRDAVLVANRNDADQIKNLVDQLPPHLL